MLHKDQIVNSFKGELGLKEADSIDTNTLQSAYRSISSPSQKQQGAFQALQLYNKLISGEITADDQLTLIEDEDIRKQFVVNLIYLQALVPNQNSNIHDFINVQSQSNLEFASNVFEEVEESVKKLYKDDASMLTKLSDDLGKKFGIDPKFLNHNDFSLSLTFKKSKDDLNEQLRNYNMEPGRRNALEKENILIDFIGKLDTFTTVKKQITDKIDDVLVAKLNKDKKDLIEVSEDQFSAVFPLLKKMGMNVEERLLARTLTFSKLSQAMEKSPFNETAMSALRQFELLVKELPEMIGEAKKEPDKAKFSEIVKKINERLKSAIKNEDFVRGLLVLNDDQRSFLVLNLDKDNLTQLDQTIQKNIKQETELKANNLWQPINKFKSEIGYKISHDKQNKIKEATLFQEKKVAEEEEKLFNKISITIENLKLLKAKNITVKDKILVQEQPKTNKFFDNMKLQDTKLHKEKKESLAEVARLMKNLPEKDDDKLKYISALYKAILKALAASQAFQNKGKIFNKKANVFDTTTILLDKMKTEMQNEFPDIIKNISLEKVPEERKSKRRSRSPH